jgi:hypothetical protein
MNKAKSPKVARSNRAGQAKSMGLDYSEQISKNYRHGQLKYMQKNAY